MAAGRDELSHQGRNHVGGLRVEIVAGAVEIHRQEVDALEPVLLPVGLEHYQQGLLGDRIGSVGLFGISAPKVFFAEGNGREFRVGGDRAQLDELFSDPSGGRAR